MVRVRLIVFICLICVYYSTAYKIYFEHEGTWEEDTDVFKDKKYQKKQWIYPGTKWCGTGNIAKNDDDLGSAIETDMCCRTHDHCSDIIESKETNHNLTNNSFYTKLNCKCDKEFYECLKNSTLKSAKTVGHIYFNALGTQCFQLDFPIVKCIKYDSYIENRCIEYELNKRSPKSWEWFDVPPF